MCGPPVGGLFGFKFSSRRHPRKFVVKRFLEVREVAGAEVGWLIFGLPPSEKKFTGGEDIAAARFGTEKALELLARFSATAVKCGLSRQSRYTRGPGSNPRPLIA